MSVLNVEKPAFMAEEDIAIFEDAVGKFFDEHAPEATVAKWRKNHCVDRDMWTKAGEAGLLGLSTPEQYGGAGGDYRHEVVLMEQLGLKGVDGFGASLHNAIVMPYIFHYGTEEQKQRWLPRMATGELVGAIAMTEPGAGSDLQGIKTTAKKVGNQYVINGSKTFITNGQTANLICVVVKTDPTAGARGTSLIFVETDGAEGFERGRNLDKLGQEAQDTSELFFNDVKVPTENLLGVDEGQGFFQLMGQLPQERLNIAVQGMATIERALELTIAYVKDRKAFGKAVIDFQNTQFVLAECKTEATVARVFVNHCIGQHLEGKLDAATASMAKYWVSDLENKIVDRCLQLFGGYGFMNEYPIARMYKDSRIQRIYGGTNEIMKLLIARTL
ncbi:MULTISPECIES: acyl-CoA dehydrogenase family protein [Caulobacter]|jgi:acyl-CoA dehydrogenase|uniref:Acyl-[acyl-carrier-protein] dehydrogenase MbtN n=1 Tax=Caulobacter vibrioides OR37 TaxID=1292034 RepID=R0ENP6_CAUVI|nr:MULTISPECIES: acyl-CoA dehydrogenase family protein [Caulobacter]ENZ82667.1 acyl-CoA dehydrogenase [Caulobacter vibrioides OR37]MBQ1562665.1 acyl-CoA dehydrogenase family protein [Caulobacter sp.]